MWCVSRAAAGLFEEGLITAAEKDALIQQAAQSNLAKKVNDARRSHVPPAEP